MQEKKQIKTNDASFDGLVYSIRVLMPVLPSALSRKDTVHRHRVFVGVKKISRITLCHICIVIIIMIVVVTRSPGVEVTGPSESPVAHDAARQWSYSLDDYTSRILYASR